MYCADAVPLLKGVPLLFMHGTADFVISPSSSYALHRIATDSGCTVEPLYIVPAAVHCGLFDVGGEEFKRIVVDFITKALKAA